MLRLWSLYQRFDLGWETNWTWISPHETFSTCSTNIEGQHWRPYCWWNPLATKRALYRSTEPSAFCLIRKAHLQPTMFILGWGGTYIHVPFLRSAVNLEAMAAHHTGLLEAEVKQVGSTRDGLKYVRAVGRALWRGRRVMGWDDVVILCEGWWYCSREKHKGQTDSQFYVYYRDEEMGSINSQILSKMGNPKHYDKYIEMERDHRTQWKAHDLWDRQLSHKQNAKKILGPILGQGEQVRFRQYGDDIIQPCHFVHEYGDRPTDELYQDFEKCLFNLRCSPLQSVWTDFNLMENWCSNIIWKLWNISNTSDFRTMG